ncbi:MAG: hypothetical protein IJY61_01085 [Candidatus Gastranaerophilales bacterium]|nr:hypothetical protein [Candidatus Gastranaerophilales bacterium]
MIKYAKVVNKQTGLVEAGMGNNTQFYQSIGMVQLDVQQSDVDNKWYLTEKCPMKSEEEKEKEEQERIAMLSLTSADVERGIYKATGMDFDDIIAKVQSLCDSSTEPQNDKGVILNDSEVSQGLNIDIKALKIELKANNFYRGNAYVDSIGTLLGFTKEQLDEFFKTGDYTKLLKVED